MPSMILKKLGWTTFIVEEKETCTWEDHCKSWPNEKIFLNILAAIKKPR